MIAAMNAQYLLPWTSSDFTHMRSALRCSSGKSIPTGVLGVRTARDAEGHTLQIVSSWFAKNEDKEAWIELNLFTKSVFPQFDRPDHFDWADMVKSGNEAFSQVSK